MALNNINTDAISFKRLSGKAHTQQNFAVTEEGKTSNVQILYSTIFAENIDPTPVTNGLVAIGSSDGVVMRLKFPISIIPDTLIAANRSQGYSLALPTGVTISGTFYPAGTPLYSALGKLQIAPPLYGALQGDGTTQYDPILTQTNGSTVIGKFDPINWNFDYYSGILFIQDPPVGYDVSAARPGFIEAFLYVGDYVSDILAPISGDSGTTASNVGAGIGAFKQKSGNDLEFKSFRGSNGISVSSTLDEITIEYTGSTGGGGTITGATNGLSLSGAGSEIALGGQLTGNTAIDLNTYTFSLGSGAGSVFAITGSTGFNFIWDSSNKRFGAGNSLVVTGGSINYTFGDGNTNAGDFGSVMFGETSWIDAGVGSAMAVGENVWIAAYGGKAFGRGSRVNSGANYGFVGGSWIPGGTNPKTNNKVPQVGGQSAFAFYSTDGGQTDNHGALGAFSAILGGTNHNIPADATSSAILGGDFIKAESGVTNTVYFPKVRIGRGANATIPTDNTNDNLVVYNSTSGELEIRQASTISGSTGSSAQNIYFRKVIVTSSTGLTSNNFIVFCNHVAPITLTTPSSPVDGQVYKIKDVSLNALTNNITISGNGKNIDGFPTIILSTSGGGVEIVYEQLLDHWYVINFVG